MYLTATYRDIVPSSGRDRSQRPHVNQEWVKMFPDDASRPARHTMPLGPDSKALVSCDFAAVLG